MKLNKLVLGMGLAAGLMGAASAQTVLKIGYATSATSHYAVGSTVFCDDIEKGTQGRYKCQQFPNSALGGEREMIELCNWARWTWSTPPPAPWATSCPK